MLGQKEIYCASSRRSVIFESVVHQYRIPILRMRIVQIFKPYSSSTVIKGIRSQVSKDRIKNFNLLTPQTIEAVACISWFRVIYIDVFELDVRCDSFYVIYLARREIWVLNFDRAKIDLNINLWILFKESIFNYDFSCVLKSNGLTSWTHCPVIDEIDIIFNIDIAEGESTENCLIERS